MPIVDAFGVQKKHNVMADTWGHLYPEPGSKHTGYMIIADSGLSGQTILASEFPTLDGSPQRDALENTVFDLYDWKQPAGCVIYRLDCTLWFFKSSNDIYLGESIGKIIKTKLTTVQSFSPE